MNLENDVAPDNGQIQANYLSFSVSISSNNKIGGITELDEISSNPAKTDEENQKIKEERENNEDIND